MGFSFSLHYRATGGKEGEGEEESEEKVDSVLAYETDSSRFRIRGDQLDSTVFVVESGGSEGQGLRTYLNNDGEAFTVALDSPDVFYTAEGFYRIDYSHAETRLSDLLIPVKALKAVPLFVRTANAGRAVRILHPGSFWGTEGPWLSSTVSLGGCWPQRRCD